MKREGWSGLYWHTRLNNYRARGLYDELRTRVETDIRKWQELALTARFSG